MKLKLKKIIPNEKLWNKKLAYYKEYMDYVEKFNKAIEANGVVIVTEKQEEKKD